MNTLDLWKHAKELSVDEFMCLLFGLEPGAMKFDYGNPKEWPKGAILVYRILKADIKDKKLDVFFERLDLDPFVNDYIADAYANTDMPWWSEGTLYKHQLVKWLEKKGIPSEFFGVAQAPSKNAEQDGSTEPKEQAPTLNATTATQPPPTESILSLSSVKQRVSTEGQDNAQVKNTCRENPEAVVYVEARQKQGAKPEEIAAELEKAGGGAGVIGCLLDTTKANVTSAREHGKYLLRKAKR